MHDERVIGVVPNKRKQPHRYVHNEVAVAHDTVVTGSFNFSTSATHNAENAQFIEKTARANDYETHINGLLMEYPGRPS